MFVKTGSLGVNDDIVHPVDGLIDERVIVGVMWFVVLALPSSVVAVAGGGGPLDIHESSELKKRKLKYQPSIKYE